MQRSALFWMKGIFGLLIIHFGIGTFSILELGAKAHIPLFGFAIETRFALVGQNNLVEVPVLVQWLFLSIQHEVSVENYVVP